MKTGSTMSAAIALPLLSATARRLRFWWYGVAFVALLPPSVWAAPLYCTGTLVSVYMNAAGDVIVQGSWRSDYTQLCNDQGSFGGIDGITCLAWFGAAVKAQGSQTRVIVNYGSDGGYTCATLPTYAYSMAPGYFMVTQ